MSEVVIKATVNEEKESLSFSKLDAWRRIRKLRSQYGEAGLSAVSGIGRVQIRKYCSESYMKSHNFRQSTWEKYFGPWDDPEPTFVMKLNQNSDEKKETSEMKDNTPEMDIANTETVETKPEVKMPRLILEVPSLEDLDATLELYGMKMIIE